ncbi:MAG: exodeoxyribonuclease VII small subunit [Planctomycetota bacterium]|nr:MAG: exodeoxyribonuclease VII small subunit [Planctomycetota bacterium]
MKQPKSEASAAAPDPSGAASAASTAASASTSFDARLAALEAVAAELESGALPLERAIERYQHGIALLKQCQQELDSYKRKVEELSAEAEAGLRRSDAGPARQE